MTETNCKCLTEILKSFDSPNINCAPYTIEGDNAVYAAPFASSQIYRELRKIDKKAAGLFCQWNSPFIRNPLSREIENECSMFRHMDTEGYSQVDQINLDYLTRKGEEYFSKAGMLKQSAKSSAKDVFNSLAHAYKHFEKAVELFPGSKKAYLLLLQSAVELCILYNTGSSGFLESFVQDTGRKISHAPQPHHSDGSFLLIVGFFYGVVQKPDLSEDYFGKAIKAKPALAKEVDFLKKKIADIGAFQGHLKPEKSEILSKAQ